MTTRSKTPVATPPATGTRARSTAPVVDRAQRPITPLDPDSAKGRQVAARLSEVIADVEHAVATRQAAERRRSTA